MPIANVKDLRLGRVDIASCTRIAVEDFQALVRNGCSVRNSDVLLSKDGTIGKVVVYRQPEELVALSSIAIIRPSEGVDSGFLGHALQSQDLNRQYGALASGSALRRLVLRDISRLVVPVPKLEEQTRLATVLDAVDEAIANTEMLVGKLEQVRAGLLDDLLTHGLNTDGRLRDPIAHPEQFKDSAFGIIPKDWNWVLLGQMAVIETGDKDTQDRVDHGLYPFYVRSDVVERINSFSFDCEAILTAGDGVGVGKVVHYASGKFECHQRVYCIHDFPAEICGRFLYYYFRENFGRRVARMSAKNSVDSVRMNMLADMPIPRPPRAEQVAIARHLDSIDTVVKQEGAELEKLRQLKLGLMRDLLSGRVRVPETQGNS